MPRGERPLPPDGSALTAFAAGLRTLRAKSGSPSYRELARRAHYSSTTLADAAAGQRLPTLAVTLAYVRACGGDPDEWTERWHTLAADSHEETDDDACPYAGLAAFQPQDADRFFGRERLTDELVERARSGRFLAVLGASGSGKSSLLRAGLVARLRDEPVFLITPGPHPLEECATALGMALSGADELRQDPRALHRTALRSGADLTLVVDQFEEVFSLCDDPAERNAFITALLTAARAANSRLRVVVGIRADFFQRCSEHPDLFDAMQDATLLVGPMTVDDLRRAVGRPAARAGYIVESALLTRVVADAAGRPTALPLVSHAMRETWRRRRGNTLSLSGYEASGGLHHALANTAETAYQAMSPARQRIARSVFLHLVTLGEGTGDTRRRAGRAEFRDAEAGAVLEILAAARLITLDTGTVELTHEALLSAWPRLAGWISADRDALRSYQQLADAAAAWSREQHDAGGLLRGGRLAAARHWLDERDTGITPAAQVRDFLAASVRLERRTSRVRRTAVALLCVLTVVASAGAVVALRLRASAVAERNRAVAARMSIQAQQLASTDTSLAVGLDLAAYRLDPTPDVYTDLLTAENEPLATVLTGHTDVVYAVAYSGDGRTLATGGRDDAIRLWNVADSFHPAPLTGPVPADGGRVYWLALSPDGRTLAAANRDGTITLWNVTDPAHPVPWGPRLRGHTSYVFSVAFSPDGRHLVSASQDRSVRLWDVADPAHARAAAPPMTGTTEPVASAAYSPDGRTVVSLGHDRSVRLWNVTDPAHPAPWGPPLTGHTDTVYAAAFSPDARLLATVANDHSVRLWDVHDPAHARPLGRPLTGHTDTVYAVAFSPDGSVLATAGADQTVRLWNLADPRIPRPLGRPLTGHTAYVYWLAFSPDGHALASVSKDRSVRLWHLPPTTFTGHRGPVRSAAVDSTGDLLATGGADDTVRLRRLRPAAGATLTGHTGGVNDLAFRPGTAILASASDDHTVRLWDATDPVHPVALGGPLTGNTGIVHAVAFRPDGRVLATAGADRGVRLWDVADPAHPLALGGASIAHDDVVYDVAFRPDGRVLASGGADDRVVLWDVADPARPRVLARLTVNTSGVRALAINPDGRTLATAGADHTVRLWNITDPAHPVAWSPALTGHTSFVLAVAFSPDGRTLASGSQDQSVRLWDVADPARPKAVGHAITSHVGRVSSVEFTPDGSALATTSDDATTQLSALSPAAAVSRACATTAGALTADTWRQYSLGAGYTPPCR